MADGKVFYIVLKVPGSQDVWVPVRAINQESVSHMAAIATATNFPNVNGYCIYAEDKATLLENVNAGDFIMAIAKDVQAATGKQIFKAAVPIKGNVSNDDWNKMVEDARQKGKLMEGTGAAQAAPAPPPEETNVVLDKK
ncbi:MAG TPA: hypothetical protein VEN81_01350 [Planctomycetota bacterium]|nr:hypothetical protein [Planctomycetota bacterium]